MSQAGIINVASSPVVTETLTGNSGGPVPPTGGNINVLGAGGVTVAGNPGTSTLTITVAGSGMTWNTIGASQTLAVDNGYFCTSGGALALLLPAASNIGDTINISLDGSTSFQVTQRAGQSIKMGNATTTTGAGGSLTSTQQGDSIEIVCSVANLRWNVLSSMGNITVV